MMKQVMRTAALVMGLLVGASGAAFGEKAAAAGTKEADLVKRGDLIFQRQCAPCHGQGVGDDGAPILPGTAALKRKYDGALPPALEKRQDLNADIIRTFVRNGSGAMPMFRKSELSDADIDAIARYLSSGKSKDVKGKR